MRSLRSVALLAVSLMLLASPVQAKTTITFWHGMGGELGEITDNIIKDFNASRTNTKSWACTRATTTKP